MQCYLTMQCLLEKKIYTPNHHVTMFTGNLSSHHDHSDSCGTLALIWRSHMPTAAILRTPSLALSQSHGLSTTVCCVRTGSVVCSAQARQTKRGAASSWTAGTTRV